jgi:hypothetical protein
MENPATWGPLEHTINRACQVWSRARTEGTAGLSLAATVAGALRKAGHLNGQARRDDAVATWLKGKRDEYRQAGAWGPAEAAHNRTGYTILDGLLDEYRLHADTGTPLDQEVHEHEET